LILDFSSCSFLNCKANISKTSPNVPDSSPTFIILTKSGASWNKVAQNLDSSRSVWVDPKSQYVLLVDSGGLHVSSNNGTSFTTSIPSGTLWGVSGVPGKGMAVVAASSSEIYYNTNFTGSGSWIFKELGNSTASLRAVFVQDANTGNNNDNVIIVASFSDGKNLFYKVGDPDAYTYISTGYSSNDHIAGFDDFSGAIDAIFITTPRSFALPTGSKLIMSACTKRITLKVPIRSVSTTLRNSSRGIGPSRPTTLPPPKIPAKFTQTLGTPNSWLIAARAFLTLASSVTSQVKLYKLESWHRLISNTATLAPKTDKCCAVERPKPDAPPVIIVTVSFTCILVT